MRLVDETLGYIEEILSDSKSPILMSSFGKDSMVMLDLVRKIENIPILFFKEPFFPKKYSFANRIIEDWNLTVYDYQPFATDTISKNGSFEINNFYSLPNGNYLQLPTGIEKRKEGEDYLCAFNDILNKPTAQDYKFKWDLVFLGHKSSDKDPIFGDIPIKEQTVKYNGFTLSMPLKDWADKDIWDYIEENNVPYNEKRYDNENGYKEFSDRTYNNDYYPACYECLDPNNSGEVFCPILQRNIKHIGESYEKHDEKIAFHRIMLTNLVEV